MSLHSYVITVWQKKDRDASDCMQSALMNVDDDCFDPERVSVSKGSRTETTFWEFPDDSLDDMIQAIFQHEADGWQVRRIDPLPVLGDPYIVIVVFER